MMQRLFLLLAGCSLAAAASDQLQQIHIAFAGTPSGSQMAVSWATNVSTATPVVTFGTSTPNENKVAGSSTEYFGMYLHNAMIGPLEPSTKYFYTVGDAQTGRSAARSFVSAAQAGKDKLFRVAVYGDMGITHSTNTRELLMQQRNRYDFVFHV